MSRSQPTLINPAQHFMSWSGSTGTLQWYNKETKANVPVKLPFRFLVLDQLATIKGYNKQAKAGYYSNEVRNTRKEELHVRLGNSTVFTGMYKNEQDVVQVPKGADYTQSVYIAHKIGDQWVLGNINMKGSSRSAWFDFTNKYKVENGAIVMNKGEVQTAQTGDFYPPTFTYESSTTAEDTEAIKLDERLQIYLSQYLSKPIETDDDKLWPSDHTDTAEDVPVIDVDADLPKSTADAVTKYQKRKSTHADEAADNDAMDAYIDTVQGEDVNLSDIPF